MPKPLTENTLFYGDNLPILQEYLNDESIDLIYLDPPFNSNRDYNVLFREESGGESVAQLQAFKDAWAWDDATQATFEDLCLNAPDPVQKLIQTFYDLLGQSQMTAYLVMMTPRLLELHRVLKPTGSLYLHCDPTASHYLKLILDTIFGAKNFRNELIWQRINAKGNVQRKFGAIHDIILAYAKQIGKETWNQIYRPLDPSYVAKMYRYVEEVTGRRYRISDLTAPIQRASTGQIYKWKGKATPPSRCWVYAKEKMQELEDAGLIIYSGSGNPRYKRYLDENQGEKIPDIWDDIKPALGREALGYPTQKPLALLERIIQASSNEGDWILDPFCGCGTTIAAAQKLQRKWVGIDITHLAIALHKNRLADLLGLLPKRDYLVKGEPTDLASAKILAKDDPYQFQFWAVSLIQALPYGAQVGSKQGKKGSDRGIDGYLSFFDGRPLKTQTGIVQVKSGKVGPREIRDLRGTMEREGAALGVFLTLENPTEPMLNEARSAGIYRSVTYQEEYPRLQILTIAELLQGAKVRLPPKHRLPLEQHGKQIEESTKPPDQHNMGL